MIVKEYTLAQFKQKHRGFYNFYIKDLDKELDFSSPDYIIRTLENKGQILQFEIGYASDEWNLA